MSTSTKDAKKSAKKFAKDAKGTVHLAMIVDESGSMQGLDETVVNGINEFLHSFKGNKDADVRVWIGMFDAHPGDPRVRVKVDGKKVSKTAPLGIEDYNPRGMTPLNDAILDTIKAIEKKKTKKERAFMVILTDGLENASEASAETVKREIAKREEQGWSFLYLGANQDARATSAAIGLGQQGKSMNFAATKVGTSNALRNAAGASVLYAGTSKATYDAQAANVAAMSSDTIADDEEMDVAEAAGLWVPKKGKTK
jgi:uncharacterized protein YegL